VLLVGGRISSDDAGGAAMRVVVLNVRLFVTGSTIEVTNKLRPSPGRRDTPTSVEGRSLEVGSILEVVIRQVAMQVRLSVGRCGTPTSVDGLSVTDGMLYVICSILDVAIARVLVQLRLAVGRYGAPTGVDGAPDVVGI
jgi:hypothetical protein